MAVDSLDCETNNTLSVHYETENETRTSLSSHPKNTCIAEISEDILFPAELNEYLRNQIRCLTSEKGRIKRCLEEKEKELTELRNQFSLINSNSGNSTEQQLATQRLGELSRRVRELTAQLERQRSKRQEVEAKLFSCQGTGDGENQVQSEDNSNSIVNTNNTQENSKDDNKIIKEKLNQCQMRLCEFRNQNLQLKQELKLANKVLSNEIGEEVNLAQIASSMTQGSWRGRSQQIIALQQKVNELMDKSALNQESSDKGLTKSSLPASAMVAAEARANHARERSEAVARMQNTIQEKQEELKDIKSRLEASKARCRVLDSEQTTLRLRLSTMLEKEQHDQQLISALTSQLSEAEGQEHRKLEKQDQELNEAMTRANRLQQELTRELCKTRQLEETLKDRDLRIEEIDRRLSKEIEMSKKHSTNNQTVNLEAMVDLQNTLTAAEQERNRLMELVSLLNRRISQQQALACEAEVEMLSYKNQCQRLQSRISAMELEKTGATRRRGVPTSNSRPKEPAAQDHDINSKVEFLREQILTLRERVRRLGQEREEDLRQYIEIFGTNDDDKMYSPRTSNTNTTRSVSPLNISPNRIAIKMKSEIEKNSHPGYWSSKSSSLSFKPLKINPCQSQEPSSELKSTSTRISGSIPSTNPRGRVLIKQRSLRGR